MFFLSQRQPKTKQTKKRIERESAAKVDCKRDTVSQYQHLESKADLPTVPLTEDDRNIHYPKENLSTYDEYYKEDPFRNRLLSKISIATDEGIGSLRGSIRSRNDSMLSAYRSQTNSLSLSCVGMNSPSTSQNINKFNAEKLYDKIQKSKNQTSSIKLPFKSSFIENKGILPPSDQHEDPTNESHNGVDIATHTTHIHDCMNNSQNQSNERLCEKVESLMPACTDTILAAAKTNEDTKTANDYLSSYWRQTRIGERPVWNRRRSSLETVVCGQFFKKFLSRNPRLSEREFSNVVDTKALEKYSMDGTNTTLVNILQRLRLKKRQSRKSPKQSDTTYASLDQIRKWRESFDCLLRDQFGGQEWQIWKPFKGLLPSQAIISIKNPHIHGSKLFREFLKSEFSEENLDFWLACEDYYTACEEDLPKLAQRIYADFVALQSPNQINLDTPTRMFTQSMLDHPTRDTFNLAKHKIQALMEKDSYSRFIQSSICK